MIRFLLFCLLGTLLAAPPTSSSAMLKTADMEIHQLDKQVEKSEASVAQMRSKEAAANAKLGQLKAQIQASVPKVDAMRGESLLSAALRIEHKQDEISNQEIKELKASRDAALASTRANIANAAALRKLYQATETKVHSLEAKLKAKK